jgi:hypothetical protein
MIKTLATLTLAAASIAAHAAAVSYGPPTVVQADGLTFVRAAYTERSTVTAHALTSVLSFGLAKRADDPDPAVVRAAAIKSIMTVAATTPGCAYIAQPVTVSPNDTPRLRRVEFEQGSNQGSLAEIEGTVIRFRRLEYPAGSSDLVYLCLSTKPATLDAWSVAKPQDFL